MNNLKTNVLTNEQILAVSGGSACSTAFELGYGLIGGSLGMIFGPAGGLAGFSGGYSLGSILAEGVCSNV